jgi:hypothetical protein
MAGASIMAAMIRLFVFLLSIFHQKSGHRAVWHSTREDALRFLAERDETLADPIYDLEGF